MARRRPNRLNDRPMVLAAGEAIPDGFNPKAVARPVAIKADSIKTIAIEPIGNRLTATIRIANNRRGGPAIEAMRRKGMNRKLTTAEIPSFSRLIPKIDPRTNRGKAHRKPVVATGHPAVYQGGGAASAGPDAVAAKADMVAADRRAAPIPAVAGEVIPEADRRASDPVGGCAVKKRIDCQNRRIPFQHCGPFCL